MMNTNHWPMSPALVSQVEAQLIDEAVRFSGLAQDARTQAATYRKAAKAYADVDAPLSAQYATQADEFKASATYFQRIANSNGRALEQWRAGIRPEALAQGGWMLPSKSDGCPHMLRKEGDWTCVCAAGSSDHWAKSLIVAIEAVSDAFDQYDDDGMREVYGLIADAIEHDGQPSNYAAALAAMDELYN